MDYHKTTEVHNYNVLVVEDSILKGYHNPINTKSIGFNVVEAPIWRGYHNRVIVSLF